MDEVLKDERFAHIAKDPRYRRIPRGERKVKIDKRFKSMFKDKRFKLKYSVDKRGRPVNLTSNENLKKFYELSDEEKSSEEEEEEDDDNENSNESDEDVTDTLRKGHKEIQQDENDDVDDSEDADEIIDVSEKQSKLKKGKLKKKKEGRKASKIKPKMDDDSDSSDSLPEKDDSGVDFARGEGNVETSSSEEEDDDTDDEDSQLGIKGEFDHKWGEVDHDVERVSDPARRLAMCNMDWDRVTAKDIFMLLHSFKPANGVIHSVRIYLSEFGKERIEDEKAYGPKELRETKLDSDEEEGKVEDKEGTSYHIEKLRQYQLNRLKYHYAVAECDTSETANSIYEECDGMEYETSSTKLDLRFIPDDMEFDEEAKSECTELPAEYKPSQFTNTALSQSKVDLTWDETDRTRVQLTSKQFTSKDKDVDDADLQAYLAASSDEEDVDYGKLVEASDRESESEDEEKQIEKYKQLLQDIDKKEDRKKEKDVQMEITWEPGLKEATEGIIKKKQSKGLTPWEEYLQKKKDKKEKKREERRKKKEDIGNRLGEDSDSEDGLDSVPAADDQAFSDDDLPDDFDASDPFFVREDDDKQKKTVKEKKKKKKKGTKQTSNEDNQEKAELSLLMMDEDNDKKKHFSLEKLMEDSGGKKKKKKKLGKDKKMKEEDDFQVELDDPRFSAVYSSHLYNIDPSAPEYRKTKGTDAMIKEKLKRSDINAKKHKLINTGDTSKHKKRKKDSDFKSKLTEKEVSSKSDAGKSRDNSLQFLVKSVKAKTEQYHSKKKKR